MIRPQPWLVDTNGLPASKYAEPYPGSVSESVFVKVLPNGRAVGLPLSSKNEIENLAGWLPVLMTKIPVVQVSPAAKWARATP